MENLLRDGDYVPNGFGGFTRLYGAQEVLAKALFKLTCRRGSFPFLQDLGSRLYELGRLRPSEREAAAKKPSQSPKHLKQAKQQLFLKSRPQQVKHRQKQKDLQAMRTNFSRLTKFTLSISSFPMRAGLTLKRIPRARRNMKPT